MKKTTCDNNTGALFTYYHSCLGTDAWRTGPQCILLPDTVFTSSTPNLPRDVNFSSFAHEMKIVSSRHACVTVASFISAWSWFTDAQSHSHPSRLVSFKILFILWQRLHENQHKTIDFSHVTSSNGSNQSEHLVRLKKWVYVHYQSRLDTPSHSMGFLYF